MGSGHDHDLGGVAGHWSQWTSRPLLLSALAAVALATLATATGLVLLWPDGSGGRTARDAAREIGLASEQLPATVESVTEEACAVDTVCRTIVVVVHDGPDAGALVSLDEFDTGERSYTAGLDVGDDLIVSYEPTTASYFYGDRDRRQPLAALAVVFVLVVVALARVRGLLALAAMGFTLVLLVAFVAPAVLDGSDPLLVCVVAASAIAIVTLYLTHGFTPGTTMALAGTLSALALTLAVSWFSFGLFEFTGLATEEGLTLPFLSGDLDLPALLLGGAILGALGALDDVTVTQVATVAELHHRNPDLSRRQLLASGLRVGREHIAATVNTLLLAYVGASLTLILLFAATDQSLDMVINSEIVAVEIARTLCGSIGLVAAVPLTTGLAAALVVSTTAGHRHPNDIELATPTWEDFAPEPDD